MAKKHYWDGVTRRTACGKIPHKVLKTNIKSLVTCKVCRKAIG